MIIDAILAKAMSVGSGSSGGGSGLPVVNLSALGELSGNDAAQMEKVSQTDSPIIVNTGDETMRYSVLMHKIFIAEGGGCTTYAANFQMFGIQFEATITDDMGAWVASIGIAGESAAASEE